MWWEWLTVSIIGGGVGAGELIARYRDAPSRALGTIPAWIYIALNIAASIAAFGLIIGFGWDLGADDASADGKRISELALKTWASDRADS